MFDGQAVFGPSLLRTQPVSNLARFEPCPFRTDRPAGPGRPARDGGQEVLPELAAHLSHFGACETPEQSLVPDLNEFDETVPGPWT